ncbi:phospholipid scramblase 2-like [Ornithodoros turicata]|uniref:phospholipid scramblase 2-like n=1 Tax=Ornithodoros turicata TaxID=34597 RepID=UPI00313A0F9A
MINMQQQPGQQAPIPQRQPPPPPVSMPKPILPPGSVCTPGLEYLSHLNQLVIKQRVELAEALLHFETRNKYIACNNQGQNVYYLAEESGMCVRNCMDATRCFEMYVWDTQNRIVMRFLRPLRWRSTYQYCCCCCLLQEIEVQVPPDQTVGFVFEECTIFRTSYSICDRRMKPLMRVQGPWLTCSTPCATDVKFSIRSLHDIEIGVIAKEWSGLIKEAFTDADTFSVTFPVDMDVDVKACILGCAILIDYMYFENTTDTPRYRRRLNPI